MSGNNGGGAERKLTVERVREALERSGGILTATATLLNVHRSTVYRFMDDHPELKEERQSVEEQTKDLAEAKIITAIKDGDMSTVRWYLDRKARDRGYGHIAVDLGNQNGEPLKTTGGVNLDLTKLTLDEQKALLKATQSNDPESS